MGNRLIIIISAAVLVAACLSGCERARDETPAPVEEKAAAVAEVDSSATLALTVVEQTADEVVVELRHNPRADKPQPRVMELHLRLSENLSYVSATAGAAATTAQKELVVQPKEGGVLRTMIFSAQSLERLGEGALVRFRLSKTSAAPARVELLDKMPVFAPPEANEGLLLADPLEIAGQ